MRSHYYRVDIISRDNPTNYRIVGYVLAEDTGQAWLTAYELFPCNSREIVSVTLAKGQRAAKEHYERQCLETASFIAWMIEPAYQPANKQ